MLIKTTNRMRIISHQAPLEYRLLNPGLTLVSTQTTAGYIANNNFRETSRRGRSPDRNRRLVQRLSSQVVVSMIYKRIQNLLKGEKLHLNMMLQSSSTITAFALPLLLSRRYVRDS